MNAIIGMTTIAAAYIDNKQRVADCLERVFIQAPSDPFINDVLDMSKISEEEMKIAHGAV